MTQGVALGWSIWPFQGRFCLGLLWRFLPIGCGLALLSPSFIESIHCLLNHALRHLVHGLSMHLGEVYAHHAVTLVSGETVQQLRRFST
jgi:hypothetical protein